jgi:hypothetical protein
MDPATEAEKAVDDATRALIEVSGHGNTRERIAAAQVKALAAIAVAVVRLAAAVDGLHP